MRARDKAQEDEQGVLSFFSNQIEHGKKWAMQLVGHNSDDEEEEEEQEEHEMDAPWTVSMPWDDISQLEQYQEAREWVDKFIPRQDGDKENDELPEREAHGNWKNLLDVSLRRPFWSKSKRDSHRKICRVIELLRNRQYDV